MDLFINTTATDLSAAAATSAASLTPPSELPWLVLGDQETINVKFLTAANTYAAFSGAEGYTVRISLGAPTTAGTDEYSALEDISSITNGWTGVLDLASERLMSAVQQYINGRPRRQGMYLRLQVSVVETETERVQTYALLPIYVAGTVAP